MAKGISIPIASDTREFTSGIRDGMIDPLKDVDDELKKLGRGSNIDELERDMKGAQKATSEFDRQIDKARDNLRQAQRQSRSFGDETKDSFHEAGHYSGEFKEEALANFSEVTSSFDGSMTSVVDLAQGTFGGLASLGGPVGLALGGLAALVGGVFSGMSAAADENAQKAAQSIEDMYADMVESGQQFVSQDFVNQKIQEIIGSQEELNKVKQDAAQAAISQQTALRAEAGDQDALKVALDGAEAAYAKVQARIDEVVRNGGQVSGELRDQSGAAADLVKHYQDLAANQDTAKAKADLYRSSTSETAAAMADASGKAKGFASALSGIPGEKRVTISVDDAAAKERLRQLGKAINVDMYVTPRTGRGIN